MKKNILFVSTLMVSFFSNSQLFTDDFEGYGLGDYIGSNSSDWTTWSGTEGGSEDVQTTDVEANSGVHSLYFLGQSGGGPQDVILDFGQQYNDGVFTYESAFFIKSGKTGYFRNISTWDDLGNELQFCKWRNHN